MCRTSRGCKIEDIATDKEVTRLADVFITIRGLLNQELYSSIALDRLRAEGLDDPSLLLMLEDRVKKYQKETRKKDQVKQSKKAK